MIRKSLLVLAASGLVLATAACNTVKGLGRDIESVGQAGDKAMK
ncbi:MAG: entericidin A/B family lipoprotein [Novosphingobium sp.]|nr:entericidin A/B family lipoprotein [Novosphingobium sp.]